MPAITKERAIEILREALQSVQSVADKSEGIAGWHRNGDVAGWHEVLPEVGDALAATEHITDTAATQAESFSHMSMQSDDPKRVMMKAHAHCPADLAHPAKMEWMADFFLKHYARSAAPTDLSAVEVPPLPRWIDDAKGKDPFTDDLITEIERLRAALKGTNE